MAVLHSMTEEHMKLEVKPDADRPVREASPPQRRTVEVTEVANTEVQPPPAEPTPETPPSEPAETTEQQTVEASA